MAEVYQKITDTEIRYETYRDEDAVLLLISYGSSARMAKRAVDMARAEGHKVGLFRPVTLWPFPEEALYRTACRVGNVLVVEDSPGELVEDVKCVLQGKVPVHFLGIWGRCKKETIINEVKGLWHKEYCLSSTKKRKEME